jgi:zinc transporter 10
MRDADNLGNSSVGEKLCKHKYSSYPYCYGEITTEMSGEVTLDIILEECTVKLIF